MKKISLITLITLCFLTFQVHAEAIDLTCEEGVGNVENPTQYIKIKGPINADFRGELPLAQKSKLLVQIAKDGQMAALQSDAYRLIQKTNDRHGLVLEVITDQSNPDMERHYYITMYSDFPESIFSMTQGKTFWMGKPKVVGSGTCDDNFLFRQYQKELEEERKELGKN